MTTTHTLTTEKDIDLAEDKVRDAVRVISLDPLTAAIAEAEELARVYRTLKAEAGMCLAIGCRRPEDAAGRCKTHRARHAKPEA